MAGPRHYGRCGSPPRKVLAHGDGPIIVNGRLLGRDSEVAVLTGVIAAGLAAGSAILVIGEPGIGKSALLEAARTVAQAAGCPVLQAVGVESEMHLPFGGLHQALSPVMSRLGRLAPTQQDALATALGLAAGPPPDLFLIAEAALCLLTGEQARQPTTIVVDDVQWLDPQSHQILAFLAHRAIGSRLCVIGAMRTGHAGPFADAGFPRLSVGGVDDATAEHMLAASAATLSAADLKRIREEAHGNPLALLELPRSWGDGQPADGLPLAVSQRLEQAFAGRVSELPQSTRDALLIAAVGSSDQADEILAAAAVFAGSEAGPTVLEPAVAAGLIVDHPKQISFWHPLVRSGIVQRETLTRRHAAHAALAEVVTGDSYRRTWHRAWSIVGPDDDVADALAETVSDSLRRGAVMSAVASLERSAQLTSSSSRRGQRLMQAASKAFASGRADVVARVLREAAQVDLTDLDELRVVWLTEALNDDIQANSSLVRQLCDSARCAGLLGDVALALDLLGGAALRCWWADSGADDQAEVARVLDGLTGVSEDPRQIAVLAIAEPVLRAYEVMATLESIVLTDVHDGDSLRVYALAAYGVGDLVRATDLLDRAESAFRAEGRLGMLPVVLALQLHIRLDLGDWSGAVAASNDVVTASRETGQGVFAENNIPVQARHLAFRGEWQLALSTLAPAESEAERLRINDRICLAYQARGIALLSAERADEAFTCLKRQFDPADPGYHLRESFAGVALMAEAAVDCGRLDEARAIIRTLETVAVMTPSPLLEVNLLYARAVLAPQHARHAMFRRALSHDLARWPWMKARLQLACGQWLMASGQPAEAVDHLEQARRVFDRLGAARWHRRAVRALDAALRPEPGTPGSAAER
jgi:tetratricopeptide (TPR) repeat protein